MGVTCVRCYEGGTNASSIVGSEMSFESASELEKTLIGQKCSVKVCYNVAI